MCSIKRARPHRAHAGSERGASGRRRRAFTTQPVRTRRVREERSGEMGEGSRGHGHDRQLTIRAEEAGDERRVTAAASFELNCPNGPSKLREAN